MTPATPDTTKPSCQHLRVNRDAANETATCLECGASGPTSRHTGDVYWGEAWVHEPWQKAAPSSPASAVAAGPFPLIVGDRALYPVRSDGGVRMWASRPEPEATADDVVYDDDAPAVVDALIARLAERADAAERENEQLRAEVGRLRNKPSIREQVRQFFGEDATPPAAAPAGTGTTRKCPDCGGAMIPWNGSRVYRDAEDKVAWRCVNTGCGKTLPPGAGTEQREDGAK